MANDRRRFKDWVQANEIGKGGNGRVYRVTRGNEVGALKVLSNVRDAQRLRRFEDEIAAMRKCASIPGVLPILDAHVPTPGSPEPPWFVMGLAERFIDALGPGPSLRDIVTAMRDIGQVLVLMHERDVFHRDIKPENLFCFGGAWSLGDFGLAKFDGKSAETEVGERIGPIFYIAPEMLNDAGIAAGGPADVYSFGKTLWKLATGREFPLPGSYDPTVEAFRLGAYRREGRTAELDKLIEACTRFNPTERPGMRAVHDDLVHWLNPLPQPSGTIQFKFDAATLDKVSARQNANAAAQDSERQHQERVRSAAASLDDRNVVDTVNSTCGHERLRSLHCCTHTNDVDDNTST